MTVLIFIIVLVVLIVVHEFGHFAVAKLSGMRVDEFGIGYPPRIWGTRIGSTEYTLNALPFGGFVRIYGEDATDNETLSAPRAFSRRPKLFQALTLVAGIAMNLLLAYVLITATLVMGTPRALSDDELARAQQVHLAVVNVMPGSPAEMAGLKPGDQIISVQGDGREAFTGHASDDFIAYLSADTTAAPLTVQVERNNQQQTLTLTPKTRVIKDEPNRPAAGIAVAPVGVLPESFRTAPIEGARLTWEVTKQTAVGLGQFFGRIFTFKADLSQVSGPVGIAGAVGHAYNEGLAALFTIAAIISINLAVINFLPIPALDGGRLLFVIIEAVIRRPIKPSVAATVNTVGFAALILLMVVVTGSDILKLVH
jgi:regulator of sigma E protease